MATRAQCCLCSLGSVLKNGLCPYGRRKHSMSVSLSLFLPVGSVSAVMMSASSRRLLNSLGHARQELCAEVCILHREVARSPVFHRLSKACCEVINICLWCLAYLTKSDVHQVHPHSVSEKSNQQTQKRKAVPGDGAGRVQRKSSWSKTRSELGVRSKF